jgi:lysine-arginine-ornithine-binding protein
MKLRVLLTIMIASAISSLAVPAVAEDSEVVIATEAANPPFNMLSPDGQITGFEVELGLAACEKMQRKCHFVQQDWDGIIAGLQTRRYAAVMASMGITEERKKQLLFSAPYYRPTASFAGGKDKAPDFKDASLGGLAVGTVPGIYECYLKKTYPTTKVSSYPNNDALYLDLSAGRVDLAFTGTIAIENSFLKTDEGKDFALAGEAVRDTGCLGEGVGVALRKEDTALKDAFDKAFAQMRADGTYKKINDKYFSFDVY